MINTLQILRSDANHFGTGEIVSTSAILNKKEHGKETEKKVDFENYLLDAVKYVNGKQQESTAIGEQLIVDPDSVDIHDVTIAMAEANLSLSLAQNVIDRLTKAWTEVTTTR